MKRLDAHPVSTLRTTTQLIAEGYSRSHIDSMVARGSLLRVRPGVYTGSVYRELRPEDAHLLDVHAAHLANPGSPDGVLMAYSHESAAALHRLPLVGTTGLRVRRTRDGGPCRSTASAVGRTSWLPLAPHEVTQIDGLVLTSPTRTVADLLRTSSRLTAVCAADAALHNELCTPADLAAALVAPPSRFGLPRAKLRAGECDGLAESPLESRSRLLFADAGLPAPELQVEIDTRSGRFRVDFCWPEFGVVGECDGLGKYLDGLSPRETRRRLQLEKDRDHALQLEGYVVLHWTWRDLERPEALIARIRHALTAGTR